MEFTCTIELDEEQIKEVLKKFFNAERITIFYHGTGEVLETKIEMEI